MLDAHVRAGERRRHLENAETFAPLLWSDRGESASAPSPDGAAVCGLHRQSPFRVSGPDYPFQLCLPNCGGERFGYALLAKLGLDMFSCACPTEAETSGRTRSRGLSVAA